MSGFSFLTLITGIYSGKPDRPDFTGLFTHSMVLGPMSSIALITSIYSAYVNRKIKYVNLLYVGTSILSILACLASGSRSALAAGLAGVLFFYYKLYKDKLSKLIITFMFLGFLILFSFPLWEKYTETLSEKMSYSEQQGGITSSRENLWTTRIAEFKSSILIGIGFGSVDINLTERYTDDGKVEPGSSWLALLSMTGLLGFVSFFVLYYNSLRFIWKCKQNILEISYIGALLVFFSLHMFAEGYVLSAGSSLCFYLWLLFSVVYYYKNEFAE